MREKLKILRKHNKLTHQDLAKKLGINRSYYSNIELGNKNPSLSIALKIKQVLSYDDDDIFLNSKCQ